MAERESQSCCLALWVIGLLESNYYLSGPMCIGQGSLGDQDQKDGCVPQRGFIRWTCIYGCPGEAENLVAAQPTKLDSSDVPSLALKTSKILGERTLLSTLEDQGSCVLMLWKMAAAG